MRHPTARPHRRSPGSPLGLRLAAAVVGAALIAGCASAPTNISPMPPAKYQVLGKAEGRACGSLGLLSTGMYFVPIGLNDRVARAYQEALASVYGATALINVRIVEDWNWWLIGTGRCVQINGDAIKEVA